MNLRDEAFLSRIFIYKPKIVILKAQKDKSDLALCLDGSRFKSGKVGITIVQRDTPTDRGESCKLALRENKEVLDAELQDISEILRVVLRKTVIRKPYKVTVFSDSQIAIKEIQRSKTRASQVLKVQIVKKTKQLQLRSSKMTI